MKKIILILSLILCLLGCSNEQKLDGEIIVRIADDTGARIITSGETPVSMDVDHYSILIDENAVADIKKESGGTSFKIGVEPGQHNVTVNAYNKTNNLIGSGSNNVDVKNGDTIQCEVNVSEIAGKGSIKIYVDNLSMEEYLRAEVISLVKEPSVVSYCFNPGTGFENQEHLITGLDNGFYTVRFFMSSSADSAEKEYLGEMPVRVVADKESILSCTFDPKHKDLNYYYYTTNPLSFRPNLIFNYDNSFPMYAKNIIDIGYDKERYEIEVNNVYMHQSGNDSFDYLSRNIFGFSEDGLWISPNPESLSTGTVDLSFAVSVTDKYTGNTNSYNYHLCGVEIVNQKVFHSLRIVWEPENADSLLIHLDHIEHNDSNDINVLWHVNDLPVINDISTGVEFWNDSIRIYDILSKETKVSATITETINDKQVTEEISLEYVWENFDPYKSLMDHMQMNSCKDGVAEFRFDLKYMPKDDVMLYSLNANGEKTVPGALINSAKLFTYGDGSQCYSFELPLASDCQFGTYIPILAETFVHGMKQSENVYNVYVFNYDSVSVNLIPSKNGYYSSSERPFFEVVGLERYASYDGYRIEYWLGNAEKKVITDYSGPVELILPDYSKDSSYMLKYRITLVSGDREDSTEGTLFFDYFSDGIPVLPMDKVYFLSQNEPYGVERNYSYYLMTTDGTNYYYFNDYRGYDRGWDSEAYYGFSKAYMNMMNEYELNVIRTSVGTYAKVSFRYGENGDVIMNADHSLKLLNKESGSDSYIGNWEFSDLELGITETRKILDLLVNDNDVANNLIPDAERIVTATNNDKTIFDIKAVASADSITISAVMKSGAIGLDGRIGLVSEYRPFAEITLPITMSSKGEPEIVTKNGRVGLQVSSDGSVLILKAMRNGIMVPVPLLRSSSAYESPSVTSTHFDKDMVITEQNLIDSVYEVYRNVYPEELAKMDTRISSVITVEGDTYDWSGVWKVTSSNEVLDNSSLVIFGDEALCVKDGGSVFGKCSEELIDFSSADSWKLEITEKSLKYGELVVKGKLTDGSSVGVVTSVTLTKQSRNSLEVAAACSRAEGNSFNQAVFASDGAIRVSTTNKKDLNDREIGSYSVDINNGSIIIQIDPSVYDAIIPYSSDPHLTGARLRFSNNSIQLFAGLDGLLLTTE